MNSDLETAKAAVLSYLLDNGLRPTDEQLRLFFGNRPKGNRFTREQFAAVNGLDDAAADLRLRLFERSGLVVSKQRDHHPFYEWGTEHLQRAKDIGAVDDMLSLVNLMFNDDCLIQIDGGKYLWPTILPPDWIEFQQDR